MNPSGGPHLPMQQKENPATRRARGQRCLGTLSAVTLAGFVAAAVSEIAAVVAALAAAAATVAT